MSKGTDARCARVAAATSATAVLLLAVMLRIYGLRWGLPNALHDYSYHPDEFLLIGSAMMVLQSFLPRFYNYPSLYIFLAALAVLIGAGYGAASTGAQIYLAARIATVVMAVGAVGLTLWAGRILFDCSTGIIAALMLAIAPLHVQHSHFATVDVPSTLFIAAALGYSALVLRRGTVQVYALAGVMVGLAAGTKYNAGLVVLSPIAAHFLRRSASIGPRRHMKLLALVGAALAAFVISTPGVLLEWNQFAHGLTYELRHSAQGHGLVFAGTGSGLVYTFASSLWYGLGPAVALLFGAAAAYGVVRRDRGVMVVLAFVVPYYLMISLSQVRFARYALPMYPAIALVCAWMLHDRYAKLTQRRFVTMKVLWVLVGVVAMIVTLGYTLLVDRQFAGPDPRDAAAKWVFTHIEKGSSIGVPETPWFYSPPLSKDIGFGTLGERQEAVSKAPYDITVFADCAEPGCWWTDGQPPGWAIVSSYETEDALRLERNKSLTADQRRQVERVISDLRLLRRHYVRRVVFGGDRSIRLPLMGTPVPHDMGYVAPTITIYEMRK